jgi:hypothetical protein
MSGPQFSTLLDEEPTEINRPKPLPVGPYAATVGMPRYDKSTKKKTDFVEFPLQIIAALDGVDEEALTEALGGKPIGEKSQRITFYLTEDAVYRLDEFHEHCGIDITEPGKRKVRNEDCVNRQVGIMIKHTSSDDGESVYANVAKTFPVE